jgi:hypothetical protein
MYAGGSARAARGITSSIMARLVDQAASLVAFGIASATGGGCCVT